MEEKRASLSWWKIVFLILLAVGTVHILKNHKPETYLHNEGYIFGTQYHIKYKGTTDLHKEIRETLNEVDGSLSLFNKHSIMRAINENRDTTVNTMFTEVFNLAQEISHNTHGSFDITVAPLVNAWGFGHTNTTPVDSGRIEELRKYVGYSTVSLINGKVSKKHPQTMLDCGAIAKGYGCDAVAHTLERNGIKDYMIEIGGEVATKGLNDKGTAWNISISKPTENSTGTHNGHQTVISITNKAMATSGNYRNIRIIDGKKYAHTIDPRTGYPVQHSLLSATVIADRCATADAYATAFMVSGLEKSLEICKEQGIDAYFIYANEKGEIKTISTEGFNKFMR